MKKIIKGYLTYRAPGYEGDEDFAFSMYKPSEKYSPNTVVVCEHSFDVEVPEHFDPRPELIKVRESALKQARADFEREVTRLKREIQELQALEMTK